MYAEDTTRIVTYLNARRSSVDRQVLARLRADVARGKGNSAVIRQALAEHYGIEQRPTPADNIIEQVGAQAETLTRMTDALAALTAQVTALQAQVAQLVPLVQTVAAQSERLAQAQAENQHLRALLLAATFGDRASRQQAQRAALALVNGNGSNGHE